MPAQVVIVHDDRDFATATVVAFEAQGPRLLDDALAAMDALAEASAIVGFGTPQQPRGPTEVCTSDKLVSRRR
jgi:hypothetical protein